MTPLPEAVAASITFINFHRGKSTTAAPALLFHGRALAARPKDLAVGAVLCLQQRPEAGRCENFHLTHGRIACRVAKDFEGELREIWACPGLQDLLGILPRR